MTGLEGALELLLGGPSTPLPDVRTGTGGPAGVFTLWYRDQLLYVGRSKLAASEARKSNAKQADGVTGRLRGIRRQPAVSIQRALASEFASDWASTSGTAQNRASQLLTRCASARWVETASGAQADGLYEAVESRLQEDGQTVLAAQKGLHR